MINDWDDSIMLERNFLLHCELSWSGERERTCFSPEEGEEQIEYLPVLILLLLTAAQVPLLDITEEDIIIIVMIISLSPRFV